MKKISEPGLESERAWARMSALSILLLSSAFAACVTAAEGESRFSILAPGVLRDADTNLQWTASDNGTSVDLDQAKRYCEDLQIDGGGWRLPSVTELKSIYDPSLSGVECGAGRTKCKVPSQFHLTDWWFWSITRRGYNTAWGVTLTDGDRPSMDISYSFNRRALCVRP